MSTGSRLSASRGGARLTLAARSSSVAVRLDRARLPPQAPISTVLPARRGRAATCSHTLSSSPLSRITRRCADRRARTSSAAPCDAALVSNAQMSPSRSQTVTTRVAGQARANSCARSVARAASVHSRFPCRRRRGSSHRGANTPSGPPGRVDRQTHMRHQSARAPCRRRPPRRGLRVALSPS